MINTTVTLCQSQNSEHNKQLDTDKHKLDNLLPDISLSFDEKIINTGQGTRKLHLRIIHYHYTRTVSDLLLPLEALRRVRFFSRPRSLSAPSFVDPDFSLPRGLLLSSSFLFVGDGALLEENNVHKSQDCTTQT